MDELKNSLMDLQAILERIRQKDPKIIGKIYKNVKTTGTKYILRKGGTKDEAYEIVQEAMYRFYEKIQTDPKYTLRTQPEGAVFGFIRNIWNEYVRKRKEDQKQISLDEDTHRSEALVATAAKETEEVTLNPENPIFKLMDRLGEGCKEILIAFYVHRIRLTELAIELGSSNGYLKVKKHRCMEQLRSLYSKSKKIAIERNLQTDMEDEKKWSEVDDYLMDRLDPDQRNDFENRLEKDKALQDSVELEKELIQGMKAYDSKQQFLKILQQTEEEEEKEEKEIPIAELKPDQKQGQKIGLSRWLRPAIGIAASVTIIIMASLYFWPRSVDLSLLADNNYLRAADKLTAQLESNGLAGGVTENQATSLRQAIEAFEKNEFTTAKDIFNGFNSQSPRQSYISILVDFYLAQIAWESSNYDESVKLLKQLSQLENLPITNEIHYYLGLNYLKQGNLELARASFEEIPADHKWHSNAIKIIQSLK